MDFIQRIPQICPHKLRKHKNDESEEDKSAEEADAKLAQSWIDILIDHIDTDPPFRTLTLRLISKLLIDLSAPDATLNS